METIATPAREVTASPTALAALRLAEACLEEMENVRASMGERMSQLAGKRADAIRTALEAGMTQADVARVLGISAQAVHNILRQH